MTLHSVVSVRPRARVARHPDATCICHRTRAAPLSPAQPCKALSGHTHYGGARRVSARAQPTTRLPTDAFDYVIVGGGLAGCLLANRLSADPAKRVLLLEAGEGTQDSTVHAPAGLTRLFKHPLYDWNLRTVDGEYIARGKVLGGSSATNATLYHRGSASDYDAWGLEGWDAASVLKWFKAVEDNPALVGSDYHGQGGAMHVENPIYQNKLFSAFFEATRAQGIPANPDFNDWSHSQEGYGDFQVSITARGRRADGFRQFLKPVLDRDNLTVVTRAQTKRVLMEERAGVPTAVAVEVQSILPGAGALRTERSAVVRVAAGGEVLMAAGAVHTPQILMLSGVGPADTLRDVGVDVVKDSPHVGANLQDHPAVLSAFTLKDSAGPISITDELYHRDATLRKRAVLSWALLGRGPLTSTVCDRGAFVHTDAARREPDLQMRYVAACALNPNGVDSYAEFGRLKESGAVDKWPSGITFQLIACRPRSRGSITIASDSISQPPQIDLGFLSDAGGADARTLRAGLRLSRDIAGAAAFEPYVDAEMHPGTDLQSDAELDGYIARTLHSANAIIGTCAMGAVVSSKDFTVHGVAGLRVVDSSALPRITGGQVGAPTAMLAERAAALLTRGEQVARRAEEPLMAVA